MTEINYRRGSVKKYGKQRTCSREINLSKLCEYKRSGWGSERWGPAYRRWEKRMWHKLNRKWAKQQLR